MRFTLDRHPGANLITHIGPEGIRIGELMVRTSVIVSAAELVADWPVHTVEALDLATLAPALGMRPEILILGTGARIQFPASALYAELASRGVGLEVMDTAAACRTYNVLVNEDRPVVAALMLA